MHIGAPASNGDDVTVQSTPTATLDLTNSSLSDVACPKDHVEGPP
jgi:hypothetical protein